MSTHSATTPLYSANPSSMSHLSPLLTLPITPSSTSSCHMLVTPCALSPPFSLPNITSEMPPFWLSSAALNQPFDLSSSSILLLASHVYQHPVHSLYVPILIPSTLHPHASCAYIGYWILQIHHWKEATTTSFRVCPCQHQNSNISYYSSSSLGHIVGQVAFICFQSLQRSRLCQFLLCQQSS